jgi:hypothetical protein
VSGHTPGPWKAVDLRHQKGGQVRIVSDNTDEIRAGRYNHVANVLAGGDRPAEDAKLIASAPEQQAKIKALADALEAFAATHGDCRCDECAAANKALRLAGRLT